MKDGALTVLELLIVIVIIAVLATLLTAGFSALRARSQRVQCTANLRNLYIAAEAHLQQNGSWPQIFISADSNSPEQDYANAWIAALKPFGPSAKTWICPTIQESIGDPDYTNPSDIRVDYIATPFDDKPMTPHAWSQQPWFAEVADVHGNGQLVVLTDGSIKSTKELTAGASSISPIPTP